jgi:hypothetical protein
VYAGNPQERRIQSAEFAGVIGSIGLPAYEAVKQSPVRQAFPCPQGSLQGTFADRPCESALPARFIALAQGLAAIPCVERAGSLANHRRQFFATAGYFRSNAAKSFSALNSLTSLVADDDTAVTR